MMNSVFNYFRFVVYRLFFLPFFCVSLFAATISNTYIEVATKDSGIFTIGTKAGDPDRSTDDNQALMYGHPTPGTSFSTILLDSGTYKFGTDGSLQSTSNTGDSVSFTYRISGKLDVTQKLSIVPSRGTSNNDTIEIRYTLKNVDSSSHTVGLRVMLDTLLGTNDGAPFRIPGFGGVTKDKEFGASISTVSAIPDLASVLDSLTDTKIVALFTFKDPSLQTPDRVVFGYWPIAFSNAWHYPVDPTRVITSDTALMCWWGYYTPITLAAGQSIDVGFYYGMGGYVTSGNADITAGILSPAKLSLVTSSYTYSFTPDPLTITSFISKTSAGDMRGAYASMNLPPELTITSTDTLTKTIEYSTGSSVISGGQDTEISWRLRSNGRRTGTRRFSVSYRTPSGDMLITKSVVVPGIPNAIWGQVTDKNGQPLQGVTITAYQEGPSFGAPGFQGVISPAALGPVAGTAVSQSDGKYLIPNVASGKYTVQMSGGGMQTSYFVATVSDSEFNQATNPLDLGAPQSALDTFPYPNPVREGSVQITFFAASAGDAKIRIYDAAGEPIDTRTVSATGSGWWNVPWNIDGVANGVYFYTVDFGGSNASGKIAVIKKKTRS